METWEWIAVAAGVAAGVLVLLALIFAATRSRRRSHLKERFGPEYERAVGSSGRRKGERQLAEVEERRSDLHIRTLPTPARERYLEEWRMTEVRFVSDPADAVRAAERLVHRVLEDRGYPVDGDTEDPAVYVAADYPDVAQRYRRAHEVLHGDPNTESLRKAMLDLRAVLDELLVREPAAA